MPSPHRIATAIAALAAICPASLAQCPPSWLPGHPGAINSGEFLAATLFDPDGPGPASADLYVGGNFQRLGVDSANPHSLARWDGARWHPVHVFSNTNVVVRDLVVFDLDADGPDPARLVVAGDFQIGFGQNQANNILTTSGSGYTRLGDGLDNEVRDLLVFDDDGDGPNPPGLYAAGAFRRSGSRMVSTVARWDGSEWQPVGAGLTGDANALEPFDPDGDGPALPMLAAAGSVRVNGQIVNAAVFNGVFWSRLGNLDNDVFDLHTFDFDGDGPNPPRLVAAGAFVNSNLRGQAYFDGVSWRPIAPVSTIPVTTGRAISSFDPDGAGPLPSRLFLAGAFRLQGSAQVARLLEYTDEGAWNPVAIDYSGEIYSLTPIVLPRTTEPVLLAAGTLVSPLPQRFSYRLAIVDAASFRPFGDGFTGSVTVIAPTTITGEPALFIAGGAPYIPGQPMSAYSIFDGSTFTPIGTATGINSIICAISTDLDADGPLPEQLIVAGAIESIDGIPMQNVAVYDGKSWAPFGSTPHFFTDLELFDADGPNPPILVAGGGSVAGGPGTPNYVYRWTGSEWVPFSPGFTSINGPAQVSYLAVFDPDGDGPSPRQLVVFGFFDHVGAVAARCAASFDGTTWRPLGSGFTTNPQGAFTWDPMNDGREVVIAAGGFTSAGGIAARGVAVWNGSAWSALGSGFGAGASGFQNYPTAFAVFQGELHAAGYFSEDADGPGNGIARWDGAAWRPLDEGLDPAAPRALGVLPSSLFRPEMLVLGGSFYSAGDLPNAYFARYAGVCCPSDANTDGAVTPDDFLLFLDCFLRADPVTDFNADGAVNSQDFLDFVAAFFTGC